MSDHRVAPDVPVAPAASVPVAPVAAFEPPYYAVVFTSVPAADRDGYDETASRMGELVQRIPGFLGEDSASTPGGLSVTVAYFRDLAGIEQWRRDEEHRAAKEYGRAHWYERYSLHIARVEQSRSFERVPGGARPSRGTPVPSAS